MSTYSRSDLATRALRKAGLIGAEEVPSAADLEYAQETISSDTDALVQENIAIINGSDQSVPLGWLEPLSLYYSVTMKADFGMIGTLEAEQTKEMIKPRLRRLCAQSPTGEVADSVYY